MYNMLIVKLSKIQRGLGFQVQASGFRVHCVVECGVKVCISVSKVEYGDKVCISVSKHTDCLVYDLNGSRV